MGVNSKIQQDIADAEIAQDLAAWELEQPDWFEAQDILSEQQREEVGF